MKLVDRIVALEIARLYEIKVERLWWNPITPIKWTVIGSVAKLSEEQYRYLTNNNLIAPSETPKEGETVVILKITDAGLNKLAKLKT